jgi:ABC-type uncharacterized transport system ATPase subunit
VDEQQAIQEGATLQHQFDVLTQQKVELWNQIKDMPDYEFERTEQWKKIVELDKQLLELDQKIKGGK